MRRAWAQLDRVSIIAQPIQADGRKHIIFGCVHRGDNSWADDFAHNQIVYMVALEHYLNDGWYLTENGDADELWEHRSYDVITSAHSHIFYLLRQFYAKYRYQRIWGNHDIVLSDYGWVQRNMQQRESRRDSRNDYYAKRSLFPGLVPCEAIKLTSTSHRPTLVTHGHQADWLNSAFWRIGRFGVRFIWRHLQLLGVRDPTRPATNKHKQHRIDGILRGWAWDRGQLLVAAHTHGPHFEMPYYVNVGSCVHPRCITGVEVDDDGMRLVKWWDRPDENGCKCVAREVIDGMMWKRRH